MHVSFQMLLKIFRSPRIIFFRFRYTHSSADILRYPFEGGFEDYVPPTQNLPTVSTILSKTKSISSMVALKRWREKKIKEMGYQPFYDYLNSKFSRSFDVDNQTDLYKVRLNKIKIFK